MRVSRISDSQAALDADPNSMILVRVEHVSQLNPAYVATVWCPPMTKIIESQGRCENRRNQKTMTDSEGD
jgi:hypothetical protein